MNVLVTGSNKGIGLGIAAAFAERGDHVFAVCRVPSAELERLPVQIVSGIELTSDEAVSALSSVVGPNPLDVLVCNAGVNHDTPDLEDIEIERLKYMFDVNTLGAVRVVLALLPSLREGSKVAMLMTGGLSTLNFQAASKGNYGYRMSKAALVSFGQGLARDVKQRGIAVALTSPGAVDTPLLRQVFAEGRTTQAVMDAAKDIYTVGRLLRERIDELTLEKSPAWLRSPLGDLAIPEELAAQLTG
jgi:NAD(P)-dependent dehydrogenase (short-subunit alcohol dehydrogenase family)